MPIETTGTQVAAFFSHLSNDEIFLLHLFVAILNLQLFIQLALLTNGI